MYHFGLFLVDAAAVPPNVAASVASIASVASTTQPVKEDNLFYCLPWLLQQRHRALLQQQQEQQQPQPISYSVSHCMDNQT